MLLVNITTAPLNDSPIDLSIASNVTSLPSMVGKRKRLVSYKSNTDACTLAEVPPLVTALNSFPSILMGLPSRTLAITLTTSPSCTYVVAYQLAIPGTISSGLLANGIAFLTGVSQLAANAAAAVLKPKYFKKSLRGAFASKNPLSASKGRSSRNSSFAAC